MRYTLIRSLFTVIYGLVHCSWKQRLNTSKVGYKIGAVVVTWSWKLGVGGFPQIRFSVSFFNFYIADPMSVKLRNRAVTPSLPRIPHALYWLPLQCCRRAGERGNVHCPLQSEDECEEVVLIWKWSFILMQIKLIFTRNILHLPRFESETFWNSEMAHYC